MQKRRGRPASYCSGVQHFLSVYQLGAAGRLASLLYNSLLRSAALFESGTKVLYHRTLRYVPLFVHDASYRLTACISSRMHAFQLGKKYLYSYTHVLIHVHTFTLPYLVKWYMYYSLDSR